MKPRVTLYFEVVPTADSVFDGAKAERADRPVGKCWSSVELPYVITRRKESQWIRNGKTKITMRLDPVAFFVHRNMADRICAALNSAEAFQQVPA